MGKKKKQIDSIWLRDWSNPSQADRPNQTNPSHDTRSALARTEHRAPGHEALAQSLAHMSLRWAPRPACGWVLLKCPLGGSAQARTKSLRLKLQPSPPPSLARGLCEPWRADLTLCWARPEPISPNLSSHLSQAPINWSPVLAPHVSSNPLPFVPRPELRKLIEPAWIDRFGPVQCDPNRYWLVQICLT